jgi:hypothetical protein
LSALALEKNVLRMAGLTLAGLAPHALLLPPAQDNPRLLLVVGDTTSGLATGIINTGFT